MVPFNNFERHYSGSGKHCSFLPLTHPIHTSAHITAENICFIVIRQYVCSSLMTADRKFLWFAPSSRFRFKLVFLSIQAHNGHPKNKFQKKNFSMLWSDFMFPIHFIVITSPLFTRHRSTFCSIALVLRSLFLSTFHHCRRKTKQI